MSYDYVRRTYDVEPTVGGRVLHTVMKRFGRITREQPGAAHYVNVMFDGYKFSMPCHPTELDYGPFRTPQESVKP